MSPVTHFLASWMVANLAHQRRDRAIITFAGVAPDLDGLGIVPELLTRNSSHPLPWFTEYHHVLGHNLGFALVVALIALLLSRERWLTAGLALVSFHLHLLCDLAGARGPDGYQWPISYLAPFSNAWLWQWNGQWELNAWPNFLITFLLLFLAFWLAVRRGFSPLDIFSEKADALLVAALRRRFAGPEWP